MTWRVVCADSLEFLAELDEGSIDAVVTDPPYGLEFMGKEWDSFRVDPRAARWSGERSGGAGAGFGDSHLGASLPTHGRRRETSRCRTCGRRDAFRNPHACGEGAEWERIPVDPTPIEARAFGHWCELWGALALRVLKPGGFLLSFGGTRTSHRLACALEDVGFEVRDTIAWLYASGFPKSLDVGAAIDRAAGAEREVVGQRYVTNLPADPEAGPGEYVSGTGRYRAGLKDVTAPATEDARRWDGWGTALKPAFEPITVARKPLAEGNVAANVLRHGTGAINVDAGRLGMSEEDRERFLRGSQAWERRDKRLGGDIKHADIYGLYRQRDAAEAHPDGRWPANVALDEEAAAILEDRIAGAARFFFTAKAPRAEREGRAEYRTEDGFGEAGVGALRDGGRLGRWVFNDHPTVKPVALMAWLVRMVTPPGGTVLDPFCGSGSTGVAATRQGYDFIGIDRDEHYCRIARERIRGDGPLFNLAGEQTELAAPDDPDDELLPL